MTLQELISELQHIDKITGGDETTCLFVDGGQQLETVLFKRIQGTDGLNYEVHFSAE